MTTSPNVTEHVDVVYTAIMQGTLIDDEILRKTYRPTYAGVSGLRHTDFKVELHSLDRRIEENPEDCFTGYKYCNIALNAALRRGINTQTTWKSFTALWRDYGTKLLNELSLRWLVSNADSLGDYGESAAQKAVAILAVGLANTIKLVETERRLTDTTNEVFVTDRLKDNRLFDQMTAFDVGSGDLMVNMWKRFEETSKLDALSGSILLEVLKRLTTYDTTYSRLLRFRSKLQTNTKTCC
jgi:hypothetical protein